MAPIDPISGEKPERLSDADWEIKIKEALSECHFKTGAEIAKELVPKPKPPKRWVPKPESSIARILTDAMDLHGDTIPTLYKAITGPGDKFNARTIWSWIRGINRPSGKYGKYVDRIEARYRLPEGTLRPTRKTPQFPSSLKAKLRTTAWGENGQVLAAHVPNDFDSRSDVEQNEIIEWVTQNVLPCATEYGKYLKEKSSDRYSLRFSALQPQRVRRSFKPVPASKEIAPCEIVEAPPLIAGEMAEYIKFKTEGLPPQVMLRPHTWSQQSATAKLYTYGRMLGALAAGPESTIHGLGIPAERLTFALLAMPKIWEWYIAWCYQRCGRYTGTLFGALGEALTLHRPLFGWARQNPQLAERLFPIPGIVSESDIGRARLDWDRTCDAFCDYAKVRLYNLKRVVVPRRDVFAPIMAVLDAERPLNEYRKMADEVLRQFPDDEASGLEHAEAVRAFLTLRVAMHSGLRPKNLRELLFSAKGSKPRADCQLEAFRRGELRWNGAAWEIFVPVVAFKNAESSFFKGKPYKLVLPDVGNLYPYLELYVERHRQMILGRVRDPNTFLVRTVGSDETDGEFSAGHFFNYWRAVVIRYGIYNPYTKRGAIEGLLPHGPHAVRHVLATHILKTTSSFELASYALQNTPAMVEKHYSRFLPQEKTSQAAQILNTAWQ